MATDTTLLPCPFCGGEAGIGTKYDPDGDYAFVNCTACMASTDTLLGQQNRITEVEAIAAWNTRAAPTDAASQPCTDCAALRDEVERLRGALTPSNRQQAEYMNLFYWTEPDFDECGGRATRHISMPWPKIKAALSAILARAALNGGKDD